MHEHRLNVTWGLAAALAVVCAATARPVEDDPPPRAVPSVVDASYLRTAEEPGRSIALEVAARTFVPAGPGPMVVLVGVAHIAEAELYEDLQELLDAQDLVLYESVKPAGTGGAGGATDAERVGSTRAAMEFLAGVLATFHREHARYPPSLDDLEAFAARRDPRLSQWLAEARIDAWGRPTTYRLDEQGFVLTSLGADRRVGGTGEAADLDVTHETPVPPVFAGAEQDNLQSALAKALGLAFQLDAIDYDRPHFRCSDMAMDQLQRALEQRGVAFDVLEGSLAGSSLPGRIALFLLRLVRVADVFFDGAIADALKVMLIELFSDEAFLEQSLQQYGPGFGDVLIDQRNQVVLDDLKEILAQEPEVGSIAILYGAAHMPDLGERLAEQLSYHPADEQWFTAFEVNLRASAISPAQLQSIRQMVRQQIRMAAP